MDIEMVYKQEREFFFTLQTEDKRLTGFAECNSITGEYNLEEGNRIRLVDIGITVKARPDLVINESEILEVFNFIIEDDVSSLSESHRAPLAIFEAVYMN